MAENQPSDRFTAEIEILTRNAQTAQAVARAAEALASSVAERANLAARYAISCRASARGCEDAVIAARRAARELNDFRKAEDDAHPENVHRLCHTCAYRDDPHCGEHCGECDTANHNRWVSTEV